jgi:hypothetical protein
VKDFQKIDWKIFNRPPYYQQWLVRGDTLKLATFGDRGLGEVDDQTLGLKDQWDIDQAKGHFLDRIGKLLDERRNGNPDEYYRILLKLRTILNTNDGSIPDIIKAVKFFYSSEIVHIVPDYPAGLIIEHDGEGTPGLNFNKLLAEIVPAGVSFFTKELFYFVEELPSSEKTSKIKAVTSMIDYMGYVFHNGVYRRNGQIRRRYNGAKDALAMKLLYSLGDQLFGRAMRNGLFRRDGTLTRNGFVNDVATELWSFAGRMNYAEQAQSAEQTAMSLSYRMSEGIEQGLRRNGQFRRNGETQHKTQYILDHINLKMGLHIQEAHRGLAFHNGLYRRDGTIRHGSLDASITEKNAIRVKHNFQDIENAREETSFIAMKHFASEGLQREIRRNGLTRRNGRYNRAQNVVDVQKINVHAEPFTDTLGNCSETFTIRYRKHYYHNGRFRRNGTIKHDANVPLHLEE